MAARVIPISREAALRQTLRTYSSGNYRRPVASGAVPKPPPVPGWFVRGPFPGEQFAIAARLPGKALAVWLLIHHQYRLRGNEVVTLSTALLDRVGIEQMSKLRALRHLEAAGLVTVTWSTGHPPRLRLVLP
jgi:hypothetical protein